MSDVVERIRGRVPDFSNPTEHLLDEAADEIERLRANACKLMCPEPVLRARIAELEKELRFAMRVAVEGE